MASYQYMPRPDKGSAEVQSMSGPQGLAHQMSSWLYRAVGAPGSQDIYDVYHVETNELLGVGSFGRVMMGRSKATGHTCAIKQIAKSSRHAESQKMQNARTAALRQEIDVMQQLDHRNIARLLGHFEDELNNYLVLQLCAGGRVIDFIARTQDYTESDAAFLMQQVFSAIAHMHRKNIIHRDVKPDNLLLESWSPLRQNTLKLIDFGLSCQCAHGREVRLTAGTPDYMCPQAIDGRYDTQADLWSCGATMFELLCGYVPFRAETEAAVFAAVRRGNFTFAAADWRQISDSAKELIRSLLKMNPRERCAAAQALDHEWVRQMAPGTHAEGQLRATVHKFQMRSAQRKHREPEAPELNVRAVLGDLTQWVNSLLPNNKVVEQPAPTQKFWL